MKVRSTTILSVRRGNLVALGGDGQVTMGDTIFKGDARKVRRLNNGAILAGFAGATADAFALIERFEDKCRKYPGNLLRAATELAKDWRLDKALRRLESLLAVVDEQYSLIISGSGDVIQPSEGVLGIGSGGPYALAAAKALLAHTDLDARQIVESGLKIAADICIYTNSHLTIETLEGKG